MHAKLRTRKPVYSGLSNGVRELIILCPGADIAASFQTKATSKAAHFDTATNLYLYASELNRPRPRLAKHTYSADPSISPAKTARIIRAMHKGNWNPEPMSLEIFGQYLASEHGIELNIIDAPLAMIHEIQPKADLVMVGGTGDHDFTADERQSILRFANAGGVVLFENPGGNEAFVKAAEEMATTLFDQPAISLIGHPVVTGEDIIGTNDLTRLDYRPYSFEILGMRETTPRLRGLSINDDLRLIFSRQDITHALLDQPIWGVNGYTPDSARKLLANILRFAMTTKGQAER